MQSKRKSNRISDYDYSQYGGYFITICTKDMKQILGKVVENSFVGVDAHIDPTAQATHCELSIIGKIVDKYINNIEKSSTDISVEKYVIMPNHIHMILFVKNAGSMRASTPTSNLISNTVRSLKILTTKEIGTPLWQRSYYDHVIRNEQDFMRIWEYIDNNPLQWDIDKFYNE
jgi:REP element-mobilizing transposase RayT